MQTLLTELLENHVLKVVINRGDKRNALSRDLLSNLGRSFREWAVCGDVRVVVLSAAGVRAFAAGGDVKELMSVRSDAEAHAFADSSRSSLDAIRDFPVPVIAALNGDALGGGAELAMACDWRIAAPHIRIGFLQAKLGITTAWGGALDLMHTVGCSQAMQLLCSAETVNAMTALDLGLINSITTEMEDFDAAVMAHATRIAERPRHVLAAFKKMSMAFRATVDRDAFGRLEADLLAQAWTHEDHWRAVSSIFDKPQKRAP